ncbi:hypothetical protein [Azospirillum sp. ST 5-10]|uniref:hypothetical protein n=1 Tax=unclassified Azospirillum TaxID=2630922 RepID=UPI003F4A01D4
MLIAQLEGPTCSVPSLGMSVTRKSGCPIFSLCRALINAGHPDQPLTVMRGDKPAMNIRSIAHTATRTVKEGIDGTPRIVKYNPPAFNRGDEEDEVVIEKHDIDKAWYASA